jgi:hypothetical protein
MAPSALPASEQETRIASAPSFTACAMRCACTWPSSVGGVSHAISMGTPCFAESSFAAASAPVRAERNTGFVELFAIIAILRPFFAAAGFAASAFAGSAGGALCGAPHAAVSAIAAMRVAERKLGRCR